MDDLRAHLLRLELALARRREGDLPGGYDEVLHGAFHETGASGRWWGREETLRLLRDAAPSDVVIERFEVERLAPDLVLATYDTVGLRPARRASIWAQDGGRWRIRFHQGTLL